jgi:hypothetical protein
MAEPRYLGCYFCDGMLALTAFNNGFILVVAADPKPDQIRTSFYRHSTEVNSDAYGPKPPSLLEMERRVLRVPLQEREIRVGELPNLWGKLLVKAPEFWIGAVSHKSVQRPSLRSRRASSPRASRRPAATSASNCRSQASASKSANQLRNAESSCGESRATADSISLTELMPQKYNIPRRWQAGRKAPCLSDH